MSIAIQLGTQSQLVLTSSTCSKWSRQENGRSRQGSSGTIVHFLPSFWNLLNVLRSTNFHFFYGFLVWNIRIEVYPLVERCGLRFEPRLHVVLILIQNHFHMIFHFFFRWCKTPMLSGWKGFWYSCPWIVNENPPKSDVARIAWLLFRCLEIPKDASPFVKFNSSNCCCCSTVNASSIIIDCTWTSYIR